MTESSHREPIRLLHACTGQLSKLRRITLRYLDEEIQCLEEVTPHLCKVTFSNGKSYKLVGEYDVLFKAFGFKGKHEHPRRRGQR